MTKLTYGVPAMKELSSRTGLEFLQAIRDGELPQAPIAEVLGFSLTEVDDGRAVFLGAPSLSFYNPIGGVHGGWYGTLLDSCMACAVQSTLARGAGYTTAEFSVNLVRPITVETGTVVAEGRVLHAGRRVATADGRLTDANGKLLAHGTTTCMIVALPTAGG